MATGLWKQVDGRKRNEKVYTDPQDLWRDAQQYFKWCEENPIIEEKLVPRRNGRPYREKVARPRAFTYEGLCAFIHIRTRTYRYWREDESNPLSRVCLLIDNILFEQKFAHAAVDLMNPGIVSRYLGLADRNEVTGKDGGPIQTEELGARDRLLDQLNRMAEPSR